MFKYIKIASLLLLSSLACAAGPNQAARYFTNNGGLLDRTSPLVIPNSNATAMSDVTLDTRGQLLKRNGYSRLNTTGALGPSNFTITGGAYNNSTTGTSFFTVISGTDIYRTGNTFNGTYTKITGSVSLTLSASNLAQATALNDSTVFCNELDKPFYVNSTGNAVTISTNTIDAGKTCSTYGNYLIIGNTTESAVSYPSRIRWSDINTQNSFPVLNYIDVEPNDGDKIVSIISYEDSVYIFKKRSIHRMVITGLDGPDAFIIRPVARNIGAWAKNSVKVIPNVGIAFLAQNTVYVLSDDGLQPIGDPIQRSLDAVVKPMWGNAVASVYPARYQYWIAVSTIGTTNTEVLVYDYIQKAWTSYVMNASMLAQAEDSNGNNILLSGDYLANHYKQDVSGSSTDQPNGVSQNISFSYTTADLTIDSPELTKNFKYIYLFFNVVESTTVVEAAFDYNSNYEYSNNINIGQVGALYDVAIYDSSMYPSINYKVARIEINRSARAIKLRFTENSSNSFGLIGWTLIYSTEDWRQ